MAGRAKSKFVVVSGVDYPPNKRAEPGDVVDDLPAKSVQWLLECGAIRRADEDGGK